MIILVPIALLATFGIAFVENRTMLIVVLIVYGLTGKLAVLFGLALSYLRVEKGKQELYLVVIWKWSQDNMKKYVSMIIAASALVSGLTASALIPHDELSAVTVSEDVNQPINDIDLADESVKEQSEGSHNIIDFTFIQSISNTLVPFTFRISGERFERGALQVSNIYVSDTDGVFIQKIEVDARPRDASEDNRYGLEFGDYNTDGFLDMTIRRYPGEGGNDRTNYYWLWNNEAHQFVYSWELSEVVTEENLIDFTVIQSIHDEVPPLTFRLLGRWIEGWSSDLQNTVDNLEANIHVLQVINSDGELIQEFDGLDAISSRYVPSFGLNFADYNFDGYLDMALYVAEGGSMLNAPHIYWLWDNSLKQFAENEVLNKLSDYSSISINTEESSLECYTRYGNGSGVTQSFKYIDGAYAFIYSIEWGYELAPDKEDEYVRYEIINELIDGEMVITKNYYND